MKNSRDKLLTYINDDNEFNKKMFDIATKNMIIIALDRFADFISDTSNIIVRETSS